MGGVIPELTASTAFDTAFTEGSVSGTSLAALQVLGIEVFQLTPLALEYYPPELLATLVTLSDDQAGNAADPGE